MAQQWNVPGYTEVKALGSGGFGDVVLARHDVSGTLVAIKYLRPELLADPEFAVMFRGEAEVLASVEDPNVVRLYEYVQSPAGAAIVMELIDGVSLREILARQGKTTAEAALVVLQGSLLGLAAAHRRGVVHRDYKPENVLVNGQGASKLTDFGIAARAGDRAMAAGTLAYAPPEQFGGGPASPSGDVYAATATFYECLTGRPPFSGDSAERLLYQHLAEPVPLEPVPEPLRPLIEAGMAKDPGRRPADATILVAELRTVAAGAYGLDWEQRGRSLLGEAALLLAALWPSGAPPAVQGAAVHRIRLRQHLRPRHISPAKTAIAAGVAVAVVAAVVAAHTRSAAPDGGLVHRQRRALGRGRHVRRQRLGGGLHYYHYCWQVRQDPDRAMERHDLDAGAQPGPRTKQRPHQRRRHVRQQRLGVRPNRRRHADPAMERHRLDAGTQPEPRTRLRSPGRDRHLRRQRLGGRLHRQQRRRKNADPALERRDLDTGVKPWPGEVRVLRQRALWRGRRLGSQRLGVRHHLLHHRRPRRDRPHADPALERRDLDTGAKPEPRNGRDHRRRRHVRQQRLGRRQHPQRRQHQAADRYGGTAPRGRRCPTRAPQAACFTA